MNGKEFKDYVDMMRLNNYGLVSIYSLTKRLSKMYNIDFPLSIPIQKFSQSDPMLQFEFKKFQFKNSIIGIMNGTDSKDEQQKFCDCSMTDLMRYGCRCGGK